MTSQKPSAPRYDWAATATTVSGKAPASDWTPGNSAGTPTVAMTRSSGRYTVSATARESSIARGMVRPGCLISPAEAAIRSKPWKAMKLNPMAARMPPKPLGAKGRSVSAIEAAGRPTSTARPAAMSTANTTTLPTVVHAPPPPARRTWVAV